SGHQPGALRRGLVLTASARALMEAAVTAECARCGELEPLQVPHHPLDVLCQHLAGMAMSRTWSPADAFRLVRRACPYPELSFADLRACLDCLLGGTREPAAGLPPRVRWEGDSFTIAGTGTARRIRQNLGTIATDTSRAVRIRNESTAASSPRTVLVGELDE